VKNEDDAMEEADAWLYVAVALMGSSDLMAVAVGRMKLFLADLASGSQFERGGGEIVRYISKILW
jgi:hypothetical protein